MFSTQISPSQRYLYARDLAFFCLNFFASDSASDLGRVFTSEDMTLPDNSGFLFCHTFGKTLRGKDSNVFMVKKSCNVTVCPVSNVCLYVSVSDLMGVDLRRGYLFSTTNNEGAVINNPFLGSSVANRLPLHLKFLGIHGGKTMHSFQSGCSITLSLLGVAPEVIARHVGWKSLEMAEYYSQMGKFMGLSNAASTLADGTFSECSIPSASFVADSFREKNELRGLSPAFAP